MVDLLHHLIVVAAVVAVAVVAVVVVVVVAAVAAVVERAVPVWEAEAVEAVAEAVLRRPEQEPAAAAGQSPGAPLGARRWPRSPVLTAPEPALPAGARRAVAGPQSAALLGPAARSFSVVAAAAGGAEVE